MKCLYCQNDFIPKRSTARFDTPACKLAYHRKSLSVSKVVPVSVSKSQDSVSKKVSVSVSVSSQEGEKILKFRKEEPIEERIKKYKEMYSTSTFVPNWIANGFLSKEEAVKKRE